MKIITRHIHGTIVSAWILVLFIFLGIQCFIAFVSEFGDIGTGNYHLWEAFHYVLWSMPSFIYGLSSMIGLLGCLLGLGHLASHSELIVMRVSGVSKLQIIGCVFKVALVFVLFMFFLGEYVGPTALASAKTMKRMDMYGTNVFNTVHGIWLREEQRYIHIETLVAGIRLEGITQYQFDDHHQLLSALYANNATYDKEQWEFNDVVETHFSPTGVSTDHFDHQIWQTKINPALFNLSQIDPQEMTLRQLWRFIAYRKSNGLETSNYTLELWQRLLQPVAALILILLAVPFVFGPLRTVAMGFRIVIGVGIGFLFYVLNQFFGPLTVVYQIPSIVGAGLPALLFLVIFIILLSRAP
ncbi:MAG: LPS export ABC transporter permease LptG [Gammaproteobacteria bacterium GWF2_41_13]|nr:MAG: LPS export ABC transporter permease LptG [Gammaproteobacteria bacterium GWF2_41_13]